VPEDALDRVTRLLVAVERLINVVIAKKHAWHATPVESAFLLELSDLLGKELPADAFNAANVALEFLLASKFALETTQRILRDTAVP
jgi:hypothetical protein